MAKGQMAVIALSPEGEGEEERKGMSNKIDTEKISGDFLFVAVVVVLFLQGTLMTP